jgi:sn-1 stearoyl-lipid 9-desaturase
MTVATSEKQKLDWVIVIYMAILHLGALAAFLPGTFSWQAVGVALFLHWVTGGLGITLAFHRLVTHRSFQTPKWLEYFLVFCGTLSCQGGPIDWIGMHRLHHVHSDQVNDPHDSTKGFWWSHMGWMLYDAPIRAEVPRFTKDIANDPFYRFMQSYFVPLQVVLALVLYLIGGVPFVVWGIFVRIVAVFHCTWLVNSATHMFGYRTYEDSGDRSTNCWWVALLTYGEGWHNNHHAYQHSARHGMKWWEIDMTWMTIQLLQALGLATKVKLVGKE